MKVVQITKKQKYRISEYIPKIITTLALTMLFYSSFAFISSLKTLSDKTEQNKTAKESLNKLKNRYQQLKLQSVYMQTDEYLEIELRTKYLVRRKDEVVAVVPDILTDHLGKIVNSDSVGKVDKRPNWKKWYDLFFN